MRFVTFPGRSRDDGYALIEVMIALLLISLIAALAMPGFARSTGPAAIRTTALQVAAILREDRTSAMRSGQTVTTVIDAAAIRGGSVPGAIVMPSNTELMAPARIRFMPDGRTSGGEIVIASAQARAMVSVSPDTGAVRVTAP